MATNAKTKLRHDLIALGDEKGFEPSKVKAFYGRIEDNLGVFSREFVDAVLECVEKLSHKSHHYATLVGLVHNQGKNVPLVKQLVDRLFLGLQLALQSGKWQESTTTLRFFAQLTSVKVLKAEDFFQLLNTIVDLASNEDPDGGAPVQHNSGGVQFPVYVSLQAIPFLSTRVQEQESEKISALLERVASFVGRNRAMDALYYPFRGEKSGGSGGEEAFEEQRGPCSKLEFLYAMLLERRQLGTTTVRRSPDEDYFKRPNVLPISPLPPLAPVLEKFSANMARKNMHFQTPYWLPLQRVFDDVAVGGKEKTLTEQYRECISEEDQFFVEEYLSSLMNSFKEDTVLCAKQILRENYFAANPLTKEEKSSVEEGGASKIHAGSGLNKLDIAVVFTIVKQGILQLPHLPTIPVFYHKLCNDIAELENSCDEVLRDVLLRFGLRQKMDVELQDRVAAFAAFYCSQGDITDRCRLLENVIVQKTVVSSSAASKKRPRSPEAERGAKRASPSESGGHLSDSEKREEKSAGQHRLHEESRAEAFVQAVLARICRISLYKETAVCLSDEVRVHMPVETNVHNAFNNGARSPEEVCPPCPEYQRLNELIQIKSPDVDLLEKMALKFVGTRKSDRPKTGAKGDRLKPAYISTTLGRSVGDRAVADEVSYPLGYTDDPDGAVWTREFIADLFTCVFLQKGSKTPTHAAKLMEIHAGIFRKLNLPRRIADATLDFWRHNPVRLELALDHLHAHKIVSPAQLCTALVHASPTAVSTWNALDQLLKRLLEELFFLYKQRENPLDPNTYKVEIDDAEAVFQDAVMAVVTALTTTPAAKERYCMLLRKYGGPRSQLLLGFKSKLLEAAGEEWADIGKAVFQL